MACKAAVEQTGLYWYLITGHGNGPNQTEVKRTESIQLKHLFSAAVRIITARCM